MALLGKENKVCSMGRGLQNILDLQIRKFRKCWDVINQCDKFKVTGSTERWKSFCSV